MRGPRNIPDIPGAGDVVEAEVMTDVVVSTEETPQTEGWYKCQRNIKGKYNIDCQNLSVFSLSRVSQTIIPMIRDQKFVMMNRHINLPVGGRLAYFLPNWEKITSDCFILQIVKGYNLELVQEPVQEHAPKCPNFSVQEKEILMEEIQKLILKDAVEIVQPSQDQFLSQMFVVPKKDGGNRPVINLRNLNHFIAYHHFKMEGLYMVKDLLKRQDWVCKIDLKDAYLTLSLAVSRRKYLRFPWEGKIY